MTDHNAIFRQEALEFRAGGRSTPGGVVRLGAWWLRWGYRVTLLLVAAAIASLWIIPIGERTSGPAVVDGRTGTVAALLPAVADAELRNSHGLMIAVPGRDSSSARVTVLHAQLATDAVTRKAGLVPMTQPAILLTGKLNPGALRGPVTGASRLHSTVSVLLRTESLASVLARQFGTMLGHSQGQP
jgi:hypothetical protein